MPTATLTDSILAAALQGLELQHERVSAQIAAVRAQLGSAASSPMSDAPVATAPRSRISAAGRRAIAEAQRKRWAAKKQEAETPEQKPKRRLSAAGRRAIIEATRKRWAAVRAAKAAAEKSAKAATE